MHALLRNIRFLSFLLYCITVAGSFTAAVRFQICCPRNLYSAAGVRKFYHYWYFYVSCLVHFQIEFRCCDLNARIYRREIMSVYVIILEYEGVSRLVYVRGKKRFYFARCFVR